MTTSVPAYAVPGVTPVLGEFPSVQYSGDQLTSFPVVAAAVGRTPERLLAIGFDDERREDRAVARDDLIAELWVGTGDGLEWGLSFGDQVSVLAGIGRKHCPDDLLEIAIAASPLVASVYHYDREVFQVTTPEMRRADDMLALLLDSIVGAHREFARYKAVTLPY